LYIPIVISLSKVDPNASLIPIEKIEWAILLIRGQKVILDKNLAVLYQVSKGIQELELKVFKPQRFVSLPLTLYP
jgi:hypothetical protein